MQVENDPYVIYGGDTDELGPLNEDCASLGELILKNLKKGGDRKAFVSQSLCFESEYRSHKSPMNFKGQWNNEPKLDLQQHSRSDNFDGKDDALCGDQTERRRHDNIREPF